MTFNRNSNTFFFLHHAFPLQCMSSDASWRDLFLVLTDHDVALYSSPPVQATDLNQPRYGPYPLLAVRFLKGARKPAADEVCVCVCASVCMCVCVHVRVCMGVCVHCFLPIVSLP